MKLIGTWSEIDKPDWRGIVDTIPENIIDELDVSKHHLVKILTILYKNRLIR